LADSAGLIRRGRRFRAQNANGDAAVLCFDGTSPCGGDFAFRTSIHVTPAAWRDYWLSDEADPDLLQYVPRGATIPVAVPEAPGRPSPRYPGQATWELSADDDTADRLLQHLSQQTLPRLTALADARVLLDLTDHPSYRSPAFGPLDRFMTLLDLGPTPELAAAWSRLVNVPPFDEDLQTWAEARLRERFGAAPRWHESAVPEREPALAARLAAMIRNHVTPVLASAGFTPDGAAFRRRDETGRLVAQPTLAWSALRDDLVFFVHTGGGPTTSTHHAEDARLCPPPEHAHERTQTTLGLDLWHSPIGNDDLCGEALASALAAWLDTSPPAPGRG
jgi:hypothetical protein